MTEPPKVIDTCVHHRWRSSPSEVDLLEYLPQGWRDYLGKPGSLRAGGGVRRLLPAPFYSNPMGDDLASATPPEGGAPGSSLDALDADVLLPDHVDRALLLHDRAMFAPATVFVYLASPLCRALNDWTIEQWLTRDERLHGVVVANTQLPEEGAAEIRRLGDHPRMAGVLLAASPSGKFFGHPSYFPIIEAACEYDLPLIIHRGGDALYETATRPAGGAPYTFAEYATIAPLALISQVSSLITTGALERYPSLRVYIVGGGFGWVPGMVRRADVTWRAFRYEVPWVRKPPREYFAEHFRVSTYGMERGAGATAMRRLLEQHPEMRDLIVYGSGYPSWDTANVAALDAAIPSEWLPQVLHENADDFLRWQPAAPTSAGTVAAPSSVGGE